MEATHEMNVKVTAWRYQPDKNIPIWVFKRFHRCGGDGLSAIIHNQVVEVKAGEWIVNCDGELGVIPNEQFVETFKPLK